MILASGYAYGTDIAASFESSFLAAGGVAVEIVQIPNGSTDVAPVVAAVSSSDADIIYAAFFVSDFKLFVEELSRTDAASLDKLFLIDQLTGDLSPFGIDSTSSNVASFGIEDLVAGLSGIRSAGPDPSWVSFFQQQTGLQATAFSANSFDAAVMCIAAVAAAGNVDPVAIRDNLRGVGDGGVKFEYTEVAELFAAAANGEDVDYDGAGTHAKLDGLGDVEAVGAQFAFWTFDANGAAILTEQVVYGR